MLTPTNLKTLVVGGTLGVATLFSSAALGARCDGSNKGVMPSCVSANVRAAPDTMFGKRAGYKIVNSCDHHVMLELDLRNQKDRTILVAAGQTRKGTSSKRPWGIRVGSYIRGFRCCKRYKSRKIRCGD